MLCTTQLTSDHWPVCMCHCIFLGINPCVTLSHDPCLNHATWWQPVCHFPHISKDVQVTWGLGTRCRQRMPMLSVRRAVTQRPQTDCKTLTRSPHIDTLDHLISRNWPSSSSHHLMRRTTAMSTPGQDKRDSLSQKRMKE